MYFINLVLQFYSRKIFLDYLGAEILGLNTTATNILQFLNLAELGISSAVAFSLYKPLNDGDTKTINEIISLQGYIYRRIALLIICAALVVMCFFPWIFSNTSFPLWYAYISFGALLISSLLGYFFNYRQVLLSASQQEYKIVYSFKAINLIKLFAQIFAVQYFQDGFIWWAILECIFAIVGTYTLHLTTMKNFPFLKDSGQTVKYLRKKYNEIEIKIKQLFVHKVSGFALSQISPLIIFAYGTLTEVTYYQNYMLIYLGFTSLMNSVFNGISASIGNASVSDKSRLGIIFNELFGLRFYLSVAIAYIFYRLTPDFITLWIGPEYVLPKTSTLLISIMLFIGLSRQTVENFLQALGQYSDVWAPITETILNVGLSIVLGYQYGLNGILVGVIISLISIVILWKPYFLYHYGLKKNIKQYILMYLKNALVSLLALFVITIITDNIHVEISGWKSFITYSLCFTACVFVIILVFMLIFRCEIVLFLRRMSVFFKHKG